MGGNQCIPLVPSYDDGSLLGLLRALPKYTDRCIASGEKLRHVNESPLSEGCASAYTSECIVAVLKTPYEMKGVDLMDRVDNATMGDGA